MDKKAKILVVDDVAKNVKLLEAHLLPQGYEVIGAYSAAEAFAKTDEIQPDIILLDIMLGDMDGFQVCEKIRNSYPGVPLPIIGITATMTQSADKDFAEKIGFDDYLAKPFNKTDLLSKIEELLQKAKDGTLPSLLNMKKSKPTVNLFDEEDNNKDSDGGDDLIYLE